MLAAIRIMPKIIPTQKIFMTIIMTIFMTITTRKIIIMNTVDLKKLRLISVGAKILLLCWWCCRRNCFNQMPQAALGDNDRHSPSASCSILHIQKTASTAKAILAVLAGAEGIEVALQPLLRYPAKNFLGALFFCRPLRRYCLAVSAAGSARR